MFERIFNLLSDDFDFEYGMLDSTTRRHQRHYPMLEGVSLGDLLGDRTHDADGCATIPRQQRGIEGSSRQESDVSISQTVMPRGINGDISSRGSSRNPKNATALPTEHAGPAPASPHDLSCFHHHSHSMNVIRPLDCSETPLLKQGFHNHGTRYREAASLRIPNVICLSLRLHDSLRRGNR